MSTTISPMQRLLFLAAALMLAGIAPASEDKGYIRNNHKGGYAAEKDGDVVINPAGNCVRLSGWTAEAIIPECHDNVASMVYIPQHQRNQSRQPEKLHNTGKALSRSLLPVGSSSPDNSSVDMSADSSSADSSSADSSSADKLQ